VERERELVSEWSRGARDMGRREREKKASEEERKGSH